MTLKQRAFLQTVLTMLGILAGSALVAVLSTLVSQAVFVGLMLAAMTGFFGYLIYTWNVTDLEMKERFGNKEQ